MVVPAPRKGRKGKGIKGAGPRFAFAIQTLMNEHASAGWEFVRAETLPSDERAGLASTQTVYRDLLVFRRLRAEEQAPVNLEPLASQAEEEEDHTAHDFTDDDADPAEAAPAGAEPEEDHTADPAAFDSSRA